MQNGLNTRWFSSARVYHILIDRFCGDAMTCSTNPGFCGGTLAGIGKKVDYIASLGFTCVWLSPFYETTAYHGYHVTNYRQVDRHFGTMDDLQQLVDKIHDRGMKVIADFVPNHCSVHHPFFVDACVNRDSPYREWFYFHEWPRKYKSFLGYSSELVKINLDHPGASQYFVDNALFWLSKGIDGFRVDHVVGISRRFLRRFMDAVTVAKPSAVIIGEAWVDGIQGKYFNTLDIKHKLYYHFAGLPQETIQRQYVGLLHGVLDFEARDIIITKLVRDRKPHEARGLLEQHFSRYPSSFLLPVFLDNHDTNRIMFECEGNEKLVKETFNILQDLGQPVVVYYNTERLPNHAESVRSGKPHADNHVRLPVDWHEELTLRFSRN